MKTKTINLFSLLFVVPVVLHGMTDIQFVYSQTADVTDPLGLYQYCGTPDSDVVHESQPAQSRPAPEDWVDLPNPGERVGPSDETIETVEAGKAVLYSYPKFNRTTAGNLESVETSLVESGSLSGILK